jgi:hypothetical protein
MIKIRYVALGIETINQCNIFGDPPEMKIPLERQGRYEVNIKILHK